MGNGMKTTFAVTFFAGIPIGFILIAMGLAYIWSKHGRSNMAG